MSQPSAAAEESILGSCRLIAFVGVTDFERAKSFYRDTLGLRLIEEQLPFALVFDAQGTMLRVTMVREISPAQYTVLGWAVPDIAATAARLTGSGVKLERYGFLQQDELGIWTAPGGAQVAWFKDPDGNLLSVSQHPET